MLRLIIYILSYLQGVIYLIKYNHKIKLIMRITITIIITIRMGINKNLVNLSNYKIIKIKLVHYLHFNCILFKRKI